MIENLKAFVGFCIIMAYAIGMPIYTYILGRENGMRIVAKRIPEIRRIERLNVLAPRIDLTKSQKKVYSK